MYLFNTTFVVENSELAWWRDWMRRIYLPTFTDLLPRVENEIFQLDDNGQVPGSTTFSCQWRCSTLQELGVIDKYSQILHTRLAELKDDACLFFSTMMKSVDL